MNFSKKAVFNLYPLGKSALLFSFLINYVNQKNNGGGRRKLKPDGNRF